MMSRFLSFMGLLLVVTISSVPFTQCTKTKPPITDTVRIDDDTDVNLSRGLIVYYPFNNSLADSSGNKHDGTGFGNLQFTSDKHDTANRAVLFDGTSSFISLRDSGSLSPASFTVSAEFYTDTAVWENLFAKLNTGNANSIVWTAALYGGNGNPYPNSASFGVRGPEVACGQFDPVSLSDLVYGTIDIQPKKWYHVICIFDNGVEKIYINGILRNAITRSFNVAKQCTEATLVIGAFWQYDPYYFHGKMDEFRFYNRALNEEEIEELAKDFTTNK